MAIYLFGSQAQPNSDLDIAVLGIAPYDPWAFFVWRRSWSHYRRQISMRLIWWIWLPLLHRSGLKG
ncbi:hypothetical protein [uncultured Meiothermus sp.]|uniref:hypothetical protein n=1 Tax=uncultured Meiothermus sp. TaxID=157471 RepID=UPI002602B003|nr:hypothetical protein [uncultured Meiothermus sp.]